MRIIPRNKDVIWISPIFEKCRLNTKVRDFFTNVFYENSSQLQFPTWKSIKARVLYNEERQMSLCKSHFYKYSKSVLERAAKFGIPPSKAAHELIVAKIR